MMQALTFFILFTMYIELLENIVNSINDDVIVITFDNFSNTKFEEKIVERVRKLKNVKSIRKERSYNSKGLQFADNVVGVIRRKLSDVDYNGFYDIIANKIIKAQSKY